MASVPSIILALSSHIKVLKACIIELTSVLVRNLILYSLWGPRSQCVTTDRGEERERETECEGPKALQQLWVRAVGLASRTATWASTKLMKKQQWGSAGVEQGP